MRGLWIILNTIVPTWIVIENGLRSLLEMDEFRLCKRNIAFFKGRTHVPNTLITLACFRLGYWMSLHLRAKDIKNSSGFSSSEWQFVLDSLYVGLVIVITAFSHSQARFSAWLILQALLFFVSSSLALGFALSGWHGWWSWSLQPLVHLICCSACACRRKKTLPAGGAQPSNEYHWRSRVRLRLCVLCIDAIYLTRSILESSHTPYDVFFLTLEVLLTSVLLFPHFQGKIPAAGPFVNLEENEK